MPSVAPEKLTTNALTKRHRQRAKWSVETVSILIPCYNNEEHVGTAIESALNQTWPACEVIVVDDGSTDESRAVAQRYVSEGVRVVVQDNQGAAAARNRGFEASTGDYIQYLDADDLLHPRKVEAQMAVLDDHASETVAVCSTVYLQDGDPPEQGHRAAGEQDIPWLTLDDPVQWLVNLFTPGKGWGMVQPGAWLTPRTVVEEAGPWREDLSLDDDGEFFTRALLASEGVAHAEEGCVYYRQHEAGPRVSGLRSKEAMKSWLRSIDAKCDHLLPQTTKTQRENASWGLAHQYWSLAFDAYPDHPEIAGVAEDRAAALGYPDPIRSVSENGWKGEIAQTVRSILGWRAARKLQRVYHRM